MESTPEDKQQVHRMKRGRPPKVMHVEQQDTTPAQRLAIRIWEGQSSDLPMVHRVARVKAGLAAQGFTLDGVELPVEGWMRYA